MVPTAGRVGEIVVEQGVARLRCQSWRGSNRRGILTGKGSRSQKNYEEEECAHTKHGRILSELWIIDLDFSCKWAQHHIQFLQDAQVYKLYYWENRLCKES